MDALDTYSHCALAKRTARVPLLARGSALVGGGGGAGWGSPLRDARTRVIGPAEAIEAPVGDCAPASEQTTAVLALRRQHAVGAAVREDRR
jgi:hypothetical protein